MSRTTTPAHLLPGAAVIVDHGRFSEAAVVDSTVALDADYPAVYVTYADRTTGRVSPSQVRAA